MPEVHATLEIAAGNAIAPHLPEGFVSVGMDVKVRHLAATPVGPRIAAASSMQWSSGNGSE
jgi:fluoroacetyl-CoA thioesterase